MKVLGSSGSGRNVTYTVKHNKKIYTCCLDTVKSSMTRVFEGDGTTGKDVTKYKYAKAIIGLCVVHN